MLGYTDRAHGHYQSIKLSLLQGNSGAFEVDAALPAQLMLSFNETKSVSAMHDSSPSR